MNDRDHNRKVKDNSEDKIHYITSDFKIEDYKSYKTQRTRHHEKQSSKEEHRHD